MGVDSKQMTKELYHKPANEFVATSMHKYLLLKMNDGAYIISIQHAIDQAEAQAIHVSIRPEEFIKGRSGDIEGTISDSVYLGRILNIHRDGLCSKNSSEE